MEIGIDSFAAILPDPATGTFNNTATGRMAALLDEVTTADRVGIDIFGIGEHHRAEFLDSAPAVIMAAAAAAARTRTIRLTSAVTVIGAADPVRVFQEFATVDLISAGRVEMVVGRGSFGEAFPLFGLSSTDYDAVFAEKLDLLLKLRAQSHPVWRGRYRPALDGQGVFPRPQQANLPVWLGVGGTPQSFVRAGMLGLPLMVAVIGGSIAQFRPLVDLYREAGHKAGHSPDTLKVALHAMGFIADTDAAARDAFYPGWTRIFSTVGEERGWRAPTRAQFDATCGPRGAFLIGAPATVAQRVRRANEELGGLDRVTFQMSTASQDPTAMQRSIELLGLEVAPLLRSAKLEPVDG